MSEPLEYFKDVNVPMFMTPKIKEKLDENTIHWIFSMAFAKADILRENGIQPDYLQVITLEVNKDGETIVTFYQEVEKNELRVKCPYKSNKFTGQVFLKESWNGVPAEEASMNDHYITLYFPEED